MDILEIENAVPAGYTRIDAPPGFVRHVGEFHVHAQRPVLGLRITAEHLNSMRIAHGGLLATLADTAFGVLLKRLLSLPGSPPTVNLSLDYLSPAREGDWVEAEVELHKAGRRIVNASCMLRAEGRPLVRASGVFMLPGVTG
ncbi:MAG TPA: PaaI family thioesterase [Rubrivivax sp.]|nr:PaaI family thioesterase [Rubrivivax sp.]